MQEKRRSEAKGNAAAIALARELLASQVVGCDDLVFPERFADYAAIHVRFASGARAFVARDGFSASEVKFLAYALAYRAPVKMDPAKDDADALTLTAMSVALAAMPARELILIDKLLPNPPA